MKKGVRKQGSCKKCGKSFYKYRKCLNYCSRKCFSETRRIKINDEYKEILKKRIKENSFINHATNCWNWNFNKYKDKHGRGYLHIESKTTLASRVSYIAFNGEIPEKICICHKCDNYSCVNPDHLFLGTSQDNMTDRNLKNRTAKGEKIFNSKLSNKDVFEIRELREKGFTQKSIADKFKISQVNVSRILSGRIWGHI